MRVAVFGASGFVGTALFEELKTRPGCEVRPIIHRSGNAAALARWNLPLVSADILDPTQVSSAVAGCTHVVNCSRGGRPVMLDGLRNLLQACKEAGVQRFVHLSSVAVYGDPPPPEAASEEVTPHPEKDSYGWLKLQQDEMVLRAHERGLPSAILCPPNISGVFSSFVLNFLSDVRSGSLALVDGGKAPLNVVDVANLSHAVVLALEAKDVDSRRIFIADGGEPTWSDFVDELAPLAERATPLRQLRAEELRGSSEATKRRASLTGAMKHLVSSRVRDALRADPLLERLDRTARKAVGLLPNKLEDALRLQIEGPVRVAKVFDREPPPSRYNVQQLRLVRHRIDRARKALGYEPCYSFQESMERFRRWYRVFYGWGGDEWPLVRELEALSSS